MRDGNENDELGIVRFCYHGLILIELSSRAREKVSNLLLSDTMSDQFCVPVVCDYSRCPIRIGKRVLNHVGKGPPVRAVIDVLHKWQNDHHPGFAYSGQPMGSLVTTKPQGDGDSRQLQACGVTHDFTVISGQIYVFISMLHPALAKLGEKDAFRGKIMEFLAPIVQRESDDAGD